MSTEGSKSIDQVVAAEATVAYHTLKQYFTYRLNDCTSPLLSKHFPDSNFVKKYLCACTKTEAIINYVLVPYTVENVLAELKEHNIYYPLVIQYFDWENGGLQSKLIEVVRLKKRNETSTPLLPGNYRIMVKMCIFERCVAFVECEAAMMVICEIITRDVAPIS